MATETKKKDKKKYSCRYCQLMLLLIIQLLLLQIQKVIQFTWSSAGAEGFKGSRKSTLLQHN